MSAMSIEEKKAIQLMILDELAAHQHDQPTLLVDALLADQGHAFLHRLLSQRAALAQQTAQLTTHLLRAMLGVPTESPRADELGEKVA